MLQSQENLEIVYIENSLTDSLLSSPLNISHPSHRCHSEARFPCSLLVISAGAAGDPTAP